MARVNKEYREGAKERIIAAAIEVALEKGWEAMTLEAIAQKIGVSTPALYSYFRNRQALEEEVVTRFVQMNHDELDATLTSDLDIRSLIRDLADLIFVRQKSSAKIYSHLPARLFSDPHMRERTRVSFKANSDRIRDAIVRAKLRGELSKDVDPAESAQLISSLTAGILLENLFNTQVNDDVLKELWIMAVERILLLYQIPQK